MSMIIPYIPIELDDILWALYPTLNFQGEGIFFFMNNTGAGRAGTPSSSEASGLGPYGASWRQANVRRSLPPGRSCFFCSRPVNGRKRSSYCHYMVVYGSMGIIITIISSY